MTDEKTSISMLSSLTGIRNLRTYMLSIARGGDLMNSLKFLKTAVTNRMVGQLCAVSRFAHQLITDGSPQL
jgi:hypothetical protein